MSKRSTRSRTAPEEAAESHETTGQVLTASPEDVEEIIVTHPVEAVVTVKNPPAKKTPKPRATRKKKAPEPTLPSVSEPPSAPDIGDKLSQIIDLLLAQQRAPADPPFVPPASHTPVAPPPTRYTPLLSQQAALDDATCRLYNRLPYSEGKIDLCDYLTRKSQRKIKDTSTDSLIFPEFVYAFLGYVMESAALDEVTKSKLVFLRQIAEDREQCAWPGVLDWALTTIDRVNDKTITWESERHIAMDRLVISRSVENALSLTSIPCPDYNSAQCCHKTAHVEGRFKLEHICSYCAALGTDHQHTVRSCHRKKSYNSSFKTQHNRSEYRGKNNRGHEQNYESRYDPKN